MFSLVSNLMLHSYLNLSLLNLQGFEHYICECRNQCFGSKNVIEMVKRKMIALIVIKFLILII